MYISATSRSDTDADWVHVEIDEDEWELFPSEAMQLLRSLVRAMAALTPDAVGVCQSCGGPGYMVRDGFSDRYSIRCASCPRDTGLLSREEAVKAWGRSGGNDGRDEP